MRWTWIVLLWVVAASAAASEMWRWVDERGVVHYSDRPHPGAERVDVQPAQSYTAPPVSAPTPRGREPAEAPAAAPASYSRLSISSPTEGEMLWNIGGELAVRLVLEPPLQPGHELQLYLDGVRVAEVPQGQTQFTLSEVFRGERRLRAVVVDERGRELASSATVQFYVQQASLLNPNRPQRATPGGG